MDGLNKQLGDMGPKCKGKPIDGLMKTAKTLLAKAKEEHETAGDEELAYTYYMRYVQVRKAVTQRGEYSRDRVYYDSMLPRKDLQKAIEAGFIIWHCVVHHT